MAPVVAEGALLCPQSHLGGHSGGLVHAGGGEVKAAAVVVSAHHCNEGEADMVSLRRKAEAEKDIP